MTNTTATRQIVEDIIRSTVGEITLDQLRTKVRKALNDDTWFDTPTKRNPNLTLGKDEVSWALTSLKNKGIVRNVKRGVWECIV
jgi:restriction endonuclease Mrr